MKCLKIGLLAVSIIFSPFSQAENDYTIDPNHTYVLWKVDHFGFSKPAGKWIADGNLTLNSEKLENSKVAANIKVSEMITGLPELDKHLKDKLFFDVKSFPKATFVSDKIEVIDNKITKVHGMLTVRGVSKPVTLEVKTNKIGKNPMTQHPTVGFSANTKIKRSDFGIRTLLPGLGDDVTLEIEVEAYQAK